MARGNPPQAKSALKASRLASDACCTAIATGIDKTSTCVELFVVAQRKYNLRPMWAVDIWIKKNPAWGLLPIRKMLSRDGSEKLSPDSAEPSIRGSRQLQMEPCRKGNFGGR
jgi:hypothetical protein